MTIKEKLFHNWSKARNSKSQTDSSREKFTHKEIKKDYQLEEYLMTVLNKSSTSNKYDRASIRSSFSTHTNWKI